MQRLDAGTFSPQSGQVAAFPTSTFRSRCIGATSSIIRHILTSPHHHLSYERPVPFAFNFEVAASLPSGRGDLASTVDFKKGQILYAIVYCSFPIVLAQPSIVVADQHKYSRICKLNARRPDHNTHRTPVALTTFGRTKLAVH